MFYNLNDESQAIFVESLERLASCFRRVLHADQLITVDRATGFLDDPRFMDAFSANVANPQEESLAWRLHTLTWAASQSLSADGDFVECGVYQGFSSKVIADYLDFASIDRTFWLYDTYAGVPEHHRAGSPTGGHDYKLPGLADQVRARFAPYRNVRVVEGIVPDSFSEGTPDRIAYLHLDMNSASAEIAALEALFDRVSPGGAIVFDDYGWFDYAAQKIAEDAFMAARGHAILELPTGQGLVIKHR